MFFGSETLTERRYRTSNYSTLFVILNIRYLSFSDDSIDGHVRLTSKI